MTQSIIATRFVNWDIPELASLADSRAYKLRVKADSGEELTRSEKNWLTEQVNTNTYFRNAIPLQGWCFNFDDVLRRYWVKQYGRIAQYYAADETALRSYLMGDIEEIVEL